jgi:hypothetical protein
MRSFINIVFACLLLFGLNSAHANDEVLSSFQLTSPDELTLQSVQMFFDLEHRRGSSFEVIVPESQKVFFLLLAPTAKLIDADTAASAQAKLKAFRARSVIENYHTFDQVQEWMQNLANNYPSMAQLVPYGTSRAGRPLNALRLNTNQNTKPVLMITAATHGDELITTEVLIRLVNKLIAEYGHTARFTQLLDSHDIYFVPIVNPDGFTATRRYDGASDPNRSYPYPGRERATPTPSIAGIIRLFELIHPVGSIDFHAYGGMIMYPWAYKSGSVSEPYLSVFDKLTSSMASTNQYAYGPISKVIYIAPGSSADYYHWKSNSISLGIEIGEDKIPDPSKIPRYVQSQEESTWRFIESFGYPVPF